jgi:hypothetical protein
MPAESARRSAVRLDKFRVAWTSIRSALRLSGRRRIPIRRRLLNSCAAAACSEAQLDDCTIRSRLTGCVNRFCGQNRRPSSAPPRPHGAAASDKRDPRGRLLFTFLADVSGPRQTSSPPPQTLVVRQHQRPKLSAHCTCPGPRLWSARVATFLLTRLPANLSNRISAFVIEGSRRFRKFVRR